MPRSVYYFGSAELHTALQNFWTLLASLTKVKNHLFRILIERFIYE